MDEDDLLASAPDADTIEDDEELVASRPKGGSGIADGTSNT